MPSLRSSAWTRGAPQSGFAAAMRPTKALIAGSMGGRPPVGRPERSVQSMGKGIREAAAAHGLEPASLSELIHPHVRNAIEAAGHEELLAALGATPCERKPQWHEGAGAHGADWPRRAGAASGYPLQRRRRERVDVDDRPALSAANAGGQCSRGRYILAGREHPPDSRCASTAAQGRTPLEERGVARHRHVEGRPGRRGEHARSPTST